MKLQPNQNMEGESYPKNELRGNDRLEQLREGDYIVTEGADISCIDVPQWYDEKLFNKAKQVYKDYFAR